MSQNKKSKNFKTKLNSKKPDTSINIFFHNNLLKCQIEDLKTTLELNRSLLYNYLISIETDTIKVKNLIAQSKILWERHELLIKNIYDKQITTELLAPRIKETPTLIQKKIDDITQKYAIKQKEIINKENTIKKYKKELEKVRKSQFFKTARTEVYVTYPSKKNLDFNDELIDAKNMFTKVSKKSNTIKKSSTNLEKEVKNLKEKMDTLKTKAYNLYCKYNNINVNSNKNNKENVKSIYYEKKFLEEIKYNIKMDENDNNDEIEEEENEESSESEDNEENNGKVTKAKQTEYDNLKENYEKLKIELNICQKKINEYKKNYKLFKNKIEDIKNKKNFENNI